MSVINISGVTKKFGNTVALDHVDLTIEPNKIYGLLGRNGAGKTTLLNLITNRIFPNEGDIRIGGEEVFENEKALSKVFYMMEEDLYPKNDKVIEMYKWTKEFFPEFDMEYAISLSEKFGLNVKKRIKQLSTGYNSIFKGIIALSVNTEIVILDEPILGLDANHREMFYREIINNYSHNPRTIIISTHLIEEVSDVLEEAIVIKDGKVILKKSVEELLSTAYTVAGELSKVDQYVMGKEVIGEQVMGKFKTVTVLENTNKKNHNLAKELDLEFGKVELQKLFINLTNS
ncbi:ABC-2 type transport system ATP-binding protein [Natranaerovirga pectinivora]|uniref:ABC-2 type transport system ATP-binding protein n=1 Tax=Natranaerovirga pectinivora TaxID=682400 RepID=A0A4V2V0D4_9FIRM|nr:ABC transporter ATP-binding protein [Natranaerovirga pectinivora]TCT15480.1 ABC-2 type transport system ATP-binding protein [Natranaerovirga pectinivora]